MLIVVGDSPFSSLAYKEQISCVFNYAIFNDPYQMNNVLKIVTSLQRNMTKTLIEL